MPDFQRRAKILLSVAEREELIDLLSENPEAGIGLGNGLRKVRFARKGGGKSGGFRTIHFYKSGVGPVYLLTMFAKNEKANLTAGETAAMIRLGEELSAAQGRRQ